jgi:hypothetical protein
MFNDQRRCALTRIKLLITLILIISVCTLVFAVEVPYEKKETWQESVQAAREAQLKAEQEKGGGISTDMGKEDFTVSIWLKTTAEAGPIWWKANPNDEWEVGSKGLSLTKEGGLIYVVRVPDRAPLEEDQQTDEARFNQIAIAFGGAREGVSLNDGKWHQIVLIQRNLRHSFFVDGEKARAFTYVNFLKMTPDNPEHNLFAGGKETKGLRNEVIPGMVGDVDELQVFSRPLSEEEVASIYKDPGSVSKGLDGWWSFDGNVNDSRGMFKEGMIRSGDYVDGRFGQAIHLDGLGDVMMPAMPGKNARKIIWDQAKSDFSEDEQAMKQMAWEEEDGIWTKDWKAGDVADLASRYADATYDVLGAGNEVNALAKKTKNAGDLKSIREIYYTSREIKDNLVKTEEKVAYMLEEIDYLQDQHDADDSRWNTYKKSTNEIAKKLQKTKAALDAGDKSTPATLVALLEETLVLHDALPHRLPSGPAGPQEFGAVYSTLKYTLEWDRRWRIGPDADVVVQFDTGPYKFVFWHGCSYIPGWATEQNGPWFVNEFFERRGWLGGGDSMMEPMSDKQARYSHVRVVENNSARVVVHWRYSPCDLNYNIGYIDPVTNWGDWADEYWTIYPDGIAMRSATLQSSGPNSDWIEYQESIFINQPGTKPSDNIPDAAVTLANMKGETHTYTWKKSFPRNFDKPIEPNIQLVNFYTKWKQFSVVSTEDIHVQAYPKDGRFKDDEMFNTWDAWPVSQDWSDARKATNFNKVSHSNLTHITWKPYVETPAKRTWLMMTGMTDKGAGELAPIAKSWLQAPKAKKVSKGYVDNGYNEPERAYYFTCDTPGSPKSFSFDIEASEESPIVNLAVVVNGWGKVGASLTLNGKKVEKSLEYRVGHRDGFADDDLVIYIKYESTTPVSIKLDPTKM